MLGIQTFFKWQNSLASTDFDNVAFEYIFGKNILEIETTSLAIKINGPLIFTKYLTRKRGSIWVLVLMMN